MAFGEARGLAWLGVVGDVTDLSVKVLNANLDPTCMDVQHNPTHTHAHAQTQIHTHASTQKEEDCEVSRGGTVNPIDNGLSEQWPEER